MTFKKLLWVASALLFCTAVTYAQSGSEHFIEIEYDDVGRVKVLQTAVELAPPVVVAISPEVIRRGPPVSVIVTGTGLRGAGIEPSHPDIRVSAVTANAERVSMQLQASDAVPLGEHWLRFTTPLGSAEIGFTLRPKLPVVAVSPDPITLEPGESRPVRVTTDSPDVIDHVLTLITDPFRIVTASPNSLLLPIGSTEAGEVMLHAQELGNAVLRVDSDEIRELRVPVFVTPRYQPPPGGASFWAPLLGVVVGEPPQPPRLIEYGPFAAAVIGVTMPGTSVPDMPGFGPFAAPLLGVSRGAVARDVRPNRVMRGGGELRVEVTGYGLDAVTTVSLQPADDVTLELREVDADGRRLQLAIEAGEQAALGDRLLRLTRADGSHIPFGSADGGLLRVVDLLPEIDSVSPQLLVRGSSSTTLTLRGRRFAGATAVRLSPADGIVVGGAPSVSADGSTLTVAVAVDPAAPLGARVVTVVTGAGESLDAAEPANTVHVVAGLAPDVGPVAAPLLGVVVPVHSAPTTSLSLTSSLIGVTRGAAFSAVRPTAAAVGDSLSLQIDGSGLAAATAVRFEPADGLDVGAPTASGDGTRLSVPLNVSADAVRGLRRVRVLTAAGEIQPTTSAVALFRITEPVPVIESVAPILLVPGDAPQTLTLRGRNLSDVDVVRVLPEAGVQFSPPTISDGGTRLSATVAVAADAAPGARMVIVATPTAQSDDTPAPANTVWLVDAVGATVSPVVAPLLGVRLGDPAAAPAEPVLLAAPLLGVLVQHESAPPARDVLLAAPRLGIALGPVVTLASPRYLAAGQPALLRIEGHALDALATIALDPADGITAEGELEVAADGRSATLPLQVSAEAAHTNRRIVALTADGTPLPFALPTQSIVQVVGNEPRIDSISPIQVLPGQTFTLTIRGGNLFGVSSVTATPASGLVFAVNPTSSADGSMVTVGVTVDANAPAGPRVIQVIASNGVTTTESTPANTLTVVTGQ
jgi:hypothetical protein